jgi:predicted transglutaminase-like cysteine proteinase
MPVIIDQAHWTQLEQVQMEVDRKVHYVSDMERFGVEDWWEPAVDKGDCEDIVLAKRQRLMDLGWPADALRIAVVIDGHGALHAVLTVDALSQQGKPATYVLDSHFEHVEPWQYFGQYGYTWLERSKPGSREWSRLDNGREFETRRIAGLATQIMPASPRWSDVAAPEAPVTVTASARLLSDDPEIAAPQLTSASLDDNAEALLIQVSLVDDAAPDHPSRHGRHHGHGHRGGGHTA